MSLIPFFGDGICCGRRTIPTPTGVGPTPQAIERQMRHLSLEMRRKLTHDNAPRSTGWEENLVAARQDSKDGIDARL